MNNGCAAVSNANVEIWHVDAGGNYSEYGSNAAETFLRGIQTTNSDGIVTFTTIYPGGLPGRATHIHLEVTMNGSSIKATRIAFPETVTATVHGSGVYASHGQNPITNASDKRADSLASELVTPAGDPSGGYSVTFQVAVSV